MNSLLVLQVADKTGTHDGKLLGGCQVWECSLLDNTLYLGFGIRRYHCQILNAVAKTLRFKRLLPFICFICSCPQTCTPTKQNFSNQHVAPAVLAGFIYFFYTFFFFNRRSLRRKKMGEDS